MDSNLQCVEWFNINRNAYLIQKKRKNKSKECTNLEKKTNIQTACKYILQIVGNQENELLACLSSDQVINLHNQEDLKFIYHIKPELNSDRYINDIGFFKQKSSNMIFTCDDGGSFKCWDIRQLKSESQKANALTINFSSYEFLSADINSTDTLISIGTNKNVDDALILIYDIRFLKKYTHKLVESHSKDITQVRFDPTERNKFSSASCDGRISLKI
jgi:WD40 repeat protein